jgi:hypothetical protein
MSTPIYDAAYFIAKFEAIPDEQWCTRRYSDLDGGHCALGHCGARGATLQTLCETGESRALSDLLLHIVEINDAAVFCPDKYAKLPTPKARVLAALRDLK